MGLVPLLAAAVWLSACKGPIANPTRPTIDEAPPPASRLTLVPAAGQLPIGGGSTLITIEASTSGARGVPNVAVALEASGGELAHTQLTTDHTGHATVEWSGTATATITARAGDLAGSVDIVVATPPVIPPPSPPRPPTPPQPTPPALTVRLVSSANVIAAGGTLTFTATAGDLRPGETITFYQWDLNGDDTFESTTTTNTRTSAAYTGHGEVIAIVRVTSSAGREAEGRVRIIVTN